MAVPSIQAVPTSDRSRSAALALGSMCACAVIALVDPASSGRYPVCPTRALLGVDCPACGTLRGLHALSHGQVARALDHNVLLLVAVPVGLVIWTRWVLSSLGWQPPPIAVPSWAPASAVAVLTLFAIVRNLPIPALTWLNSA